MLEGAEALAAKRHRGKIPVFGYAPVTAARILS